MQIFFFCSVSENKSLLNIKRKMICIDKLRQVADSRPAAVNVGIFFQREIGALDRKSVV